VALPLELAVSFTTQGERSSVSSCEHRSSLGSFDHKVHLAKSRKMLRYERGPRDRLQSDPFCQRCNCLLQSL
jgi:hypothetical protein